MAVTNFGVCDFSRLAVTDWRLRRWLLCFLALTTATLPFLSLDGYYRYLDFQEVPSIG